MPTPAKATALAGNDQRRSIPLDRFAALFDVPGVRWFSLQVGARAGDLATLPPGRINDLSPQLADFAETAAAVANLDLVISADTAIGHLAGALGAPVWIALCLVPDWRWLLDRADSPWYPSVRLFRQTRWDDWQGVMAAICAAVEILRQDRAATTADIRSAARTDTSAPRQTYLASASELLALANRCHRAGDLAAAVGFGVGL